MTDRRVVAAFDDPHGLCVRHALSSAAVRDGHAGGVTRTRLAVLAWELEESARKQSWSARYERHGAEDRAWVHAATTIDGRVFLGGPPQAAEATLDPLRSETR